MKKSTAKAKRTIGIVTGSRADWNLLRPVYKELQRSEKLRPLIFITGMHLLPEFGRTEKFIEGKAAVRVPMYGAKSPLGRGTEGLVAAFKEAKVDYVLLLGDRKEMLAGALAAFDLSIPLFHIHGGDYTKSGHQDEIMRHLISILSSMHFPASAKSKERLIKLGEVPSRIVVTGSPALDSVRAHTFATRAKTEKMLGIDGRYAVVLFHPNDREADVCGTHVRTILKTLRKEKDRALVIIYPNNDRGSEKIIREIELLRARKNISIRRSMPQSQYLDALKYAEFLIGNSSGGVYECSYMGTPAINVGLRNTGREHAANLIYADPTSRAIERAIARARTPAFRRRMRKDRFYFGRGDAAKKIARAIAARGIPLLPKERSY